jgi:hypothetical protein
MTHIGTPLRIALFSLAFVFIGCDRFRDFTSSMQQSVKIESRELSMESLIERMAEKDKEGVENSHTKGKSNTVGLVDGKRWLEDSFDRYDYIRGLSDLISAMNGIAVIVYEESGQFLELKKQVSQRSDTQDNPYVALLEAMRLLSFRVGSVTNGPSFGDTVDAVTKFYKDKPLMKRKPVIWVLAIPLYKQLQEAMPPENRDKNDSLTVPRLEPNRKNE